MGGPFELMWNVSGFSMLCVIKTVANTWFREKVAWSCGSGSNFWRKRLI